MKEQDAISKRGLVWQCMQCDFAAEKRYAINHVYVYHKTTDETPYHCSLCNFKSMDLKSLQAHVWRYQAHKKAKEQSGKSNVDDKVFLVENKAPTRIMEGIDIAPWTVAKSREFWQKRQKNKPHGQNGGQSTSAQIEPLPGITTVPSESVHSQTVNTEQIEKRDCASNGYAVSIVNDVSNTNAVSNKEAISNVNTGSNVDALVRELFGPYDPYEDPHSPATSPGATPNIHLGEESENEAGFSVPKTVESTPKTVDQGCDPIDFGRRNEETQATCECSCYVTRKEHEESMREMSSMVHSMAVIVQGMLTTMSQNNQAYIPPQLPTQMPVYNPTPIEMLQQVAKEVPPPEKLIPSPAEDKAPLKEIPSSTDNVPKTDSKKKEKFDHKEKKEKKRDSKSTSRGSKEKKNEKSGMEKERKRKRTEPHESEQRENSGQSKDDRSMDKEPMRKTTDHRSQHKKTKFTCLSDSDSE